MTEERETLTEEQAAAADKRLASILHPEPVQDAEPEKESAPARTRKTRSDKGTHKPKKTEPEPQPSALGITEDQRAQLTNLIQAVADADAEAKDAHDALDNFLRDITIVE